MKTKNAIRYLVNSYRAVFKNTHIGYMALVAVLATGGMSSACSDIDGIAVAQTSGNNFNDSKENIMEPPLLVRLESKAFFTVAIHPKSSFDVIPKNITGITDGTNLVIYILRTEPPPRFMSRDDPTEIVSIMAGNSKKHLWLEASQEGLEIGENEITITKWSRLALRTTSSEILYFSPNGNGILKIIKQNEKLLSGGQEASYHGTARFHFTDPSYTNTGQPPQESIDWNFLLNEPEGALLFSIKEPN